MDLVGATFVGLTMTATAVVITLTSLKDLGLANTRVARVIIASCVIDDLLWHFTLTPSFTAAGYYRN